MVGKPRFEQMNHSYNLFPYFHVTMGVYCDRLLYVYYDYDISLFLSVGVHV